MGGGGWLTHHPRDAADDYVQDRACPRVGREGALAATPLDAGAEDRPAHHRCRRLAVRRGHLLNPAEEEGVQLLLHLRLDHRLEALAPRRAMAMELAQILADGDHKEPQIVGPDPRRRPPAPLPRPPAG